MSHSVRLILRIILAAALISILWNVSGDAEAQKPPVCSHSVEPTGPGRQHVALLIGIGDYAAPHISDLNGTLNDVSNMKDLLTSPDAGFELSEENICTLIDSDASLPNVLYAFRHFLMDRIDNEDHVTIFYAGHGGQVRDADGIESDGLDETLVLYDSESTLYVDQDGRPIFQPHLTDDVFGALLDAVNARLTEGRPGAHALTVILDSCNSLSATRDSSTVRFLSDGMTQRNGGKGRKRIFASASPALTEAGFASIAAGSAAIDSGERFTSLAPEGAVILVAAGDGTVAVESPSGYGVFSTALIHELRSATEPLTYAALEWRVRSAMRNAFQVPAFHGPLGTLVFDSEVRGTGAAHRVAEPPAGGLLTLVGAPVAGMGPGAEFRIYSGSDLSGLNNPANAKAIVRVLNDDQIRAVAEIVSLTEGETIAEGDIGIMITPSPESRKLRVRLGRELSEELVESLQKTYQLNVDAVRGVELVRETDDGAGDFDLAILAIPDNRLGIVDPQGVLRNAIEINTRTASNMIGALNSFSRQKMLRQLKGEGGGHLVDNETVRISLEEVKGEGTTRCRPDFVPFGPPVEVADHQFEVPLCARYRFVVEAADTLDREIQIGLLYLAADGNIYSLPGRRSADRDFQRLRLTPPTGNSPGNLRVVFDKPYDDVYQAYPPLGPEDDVLVFAVDARTPVPWWSLQSEIRTRNAVQTDSSLYRELNEFMGLGTRGGPASTGDGNSSVWAVTRASIKAVPDPGFAEEGRGDKREYTIAGFQIGPYLPANTNSSLYKVLAKAHELATRSSEFIATDSTEGEDDPGEGYPYLQHDWTLRDEEGYIDFQANLEKGIDCSRSIWYVFTQAGLPYTDQIFDSPKRKASVPYLSKGNDFLATADMAREDSPMSAQFESCTGEPLQNGDVLVYRNEEEGNGHTVMVIDPEREIAWGSHGWDGSYRTTGYKDRGVEYQKIGGTRDWSNWDKEETELKACWRHKSFIEERQAAEFWLTGINWDFILCLLPGGECRVTAEAATADTSALE